MNPPLTLNPLDWPAGPFIALYVILAVATLLLLYFWGENLPPQGGNPDLYGLDVIHYAYLAGGPRRAMDTALVGLFESGAAVLEGKRRRELRINQHADVPVAIRPFRSMDAQATKRRHFHAANLQRCAQVRDELAGRGLIPGPGEVMRYRVGAVVLLCLPLALGFAKVVVGESRHRPTGILFVLVCVTVLFGWKIIFSRPLRTRAGRAALARLREDNPRAIRAPLADELILAFALTGGAVLIGRDYRSFLGSGSGGDSGGCSSGGGGDGGGGGCGGCSS